MVLKKTGKKNFLFKKNKKKQKNKFIFLKQPLLKKLKKMKITLLSLLVLVIIAQCSAYNLNSFLCSPESQAFQNRHEFYIKYSSLPGEVWQHDRQIITLQSDGTYATQFRFNTWAYNYYNEAECRFQGIEINAALDGSNVIYILQELDSDINFPCFCRQGKSDNAQTYDINWGTPAFAESQFVLDLKREHTAIGKSSVSGTWTDELTGKLGLVESAFVPSAGERALSLLAVPTELSPGNADTTIFGALITFTSDSITPSPNVAETLRLYLEGNLPLGPDPTDPSVQIYRYDPPISARSVEENSKDLQNARITTEAYQFLKN